MNLRWPHFSEDYKSKPSRLEFIRLGIAHGNTEEVRGSLVFGIAHINTVGSTNKEKFQKFRKASMLCSPEVT